MSYLQIRFTARARKSSNPRNRICTNICQIQESRVYKHAFFKEYCREYFDIYKKLKTNFTYKMKELYLAILLQICNTMHWKIAYLHYVLFC